MSQGPGTLPPVLGQGRAPRDWAPICIHMYPNVSMCMHMKHVSIYIYIYISISIRRFLRFSFLPSVQPPVRPSVRSTQLLGFHPTPRASPRLLGIHPTPKQSNLKACKHQINIIPIRKLYNYGLKKLLVQEASSSTSSSMSSTSYQESTLLLRFHWNIIAPNYKGSTQLLGLRPTTENPPTLRVYSKPKIEIIGYSYIIPTIITQFCSHSRRH